MKVNEGLVNTYIAYKIIKLILSDWTSWDAYKLGLIDDKGKRTNKPLITFKEREAWDFFTRFIAKVKRLFTMFLGKSKLVSALSLATIFRECEIKGIQLDSLNESEYDELYKQIEVILKEV